MIVTTDEALAVATADQNRFDKTNNSFDKTNNFPGIRQMSASTTKNDNSNALREIAESTSEGSLSETFTQQMAHDLANSLSGIQMLVEAMRQTLPSESPLARQFATLDNSAYHATKICNQLQAVLRGEEHDTYHQQPVGLSPIVNQARELLRVRIDPAVRLDFELGDSLPPILADPTRIHQLVLDLATNASEAIDNGTPGTVTVRTGVVQNNAHRESVTIAGDIVHSDNCVFLEVVDTGCGIAEDKLQEIFEPTYTTKENGHGLGLASVQRIMHGCGGAVTVNSRVGSGTRVRCIFPSAKPKQLNQAEAEATGGPTADNGDSHSATVLLIEDNEAARRGSKVLLENSGQGDLRVLTAGNGREALDLLQRRMEEISVAILDLNLPDCQGLEARWRSGEAVRR